MPDEVVIFGFVIDPIWFLMAFIFGALFGIKFAFHLLVRLIEFLRRRFQAWRQTVLDGGDLDGETAERLAAAYGLPPGEDILGVVHRRRGLTRQTSVLVTQRRIVRDAAAGRDSFPLRDIRAWGTPDGHAVRHEYAIQAESEDGFHGGMRFEIVGRPAIAKFSAILNAAMAGRGDHEPDETIPRQATHTRKKRMDAFLNSLVWIAIPAVPMLLGAGLYWLAWSEWSLTRQQTANSIIVVGEVTGFDEKYDYDDGETAYFPQVRFNLVEGGTHTFTSRVGGMKNAYDIGEKVEVYYNVQAPEKAAIKSVRTDYVPILMFLGLGTVLIAVGAGLALLIRSEG